MADTKLPEGSWKISLKDMRGAVVAAVENAKDIPRPWKDTLIAEVNAYPEAIKAVRLDAHCHFANGKKVLHADINSIF